jgi:hypothetical protein
MFTYHLSPAGHAVISKNGQIVFDVEFSYATTHTKKAEQLAIMVEMLGFANASPKPGVQPPVSRYLAKKAKQADWHPTATINAMVGGRKNEN